MREIPLFSKKALAWLIGLGGISFVIVIGLTVFMDDPRFIGSAGADSFSPSAIGHKAFVNTLRRAGLNVLQSQNQTRSKVTPSSALLILEPGVDPERLPELKQMLSAGNVLLVLPKRSGFPDPVNRRWLGFVGRTGQERIETVLNQVPGADFTSSNGSIVLNAKDLIWEANGFRAKPAIKDPQVINWSRLTPLVYNDEGILLGKVDGLPRNLYILTDPDILQNHGFDEPGNASFAYELMAMVAGDADVIVIDETAHGHILSPNFLKSAFTPPFIYPVVLLLLAIAALVLSASARFAAPQLEEEAFAKSKLPLIRNISDLIRFGGHYGNVTERYYQEILRDVAERLYAPAGLHGRELIKWIDEIGKRRNTHANYADLRNRAFAGIVHEKTNAVRQIKLAHDAYKWRKEVLYGTGKNKNTD